MIDRSKYVPMWFAAGKTFSGHNAKGRAETHASRHQTVAVAGMGDRRGWLSMAAWGEAK